MTARLGFIAAAIVVATTLVAQSAGRDERIDKHDLSVSREACAQCHKADDIRVVASAIPRGGCDAQCATCHAKSSEGHHKVGMPVAAPSRAELVRTGGGKLACRTCHDLRRPVTDSVSWRSQSMFDAVFRRQARYHTYALAVRNDKGQLCQQCH